MSFTTPHSLSGFSIGFINAQGYLASNVDSYIAVMKKYKICLIAVQDSGPLHNIYIHPSHHITIIKSPAPNYDPAGGMAILILNQINACITQPPITLPQNKFDHRIQSVILATPKKIAIHNSYCQSNNKEISHALLSINPNTPSIILGDLNSIPFPAIDRMNSDGSRGNKNTYPVANLIAQGWTDSFRLMNDDLQAFTRWGKSTNKEGITRLTASRIDHILISSHLVANITSCTIVEHDALHSDHRLIFCNINSSLRPNHNTNLTITYKEGLKDPLKWKEYTRLLEEQTTPLSSDPNIAANEVRDRITQAFNKVFTTKTIHHVDPMHKMHSDPQYKTLKKAKKATFEIIKMIIFQNRTVTHADIENQAYIIEPHVPLPAVPYFNRENVALLYEIEYRLGKMARAFTRQFKKKTISKKMEKLLPFLDENGHNVFKLLRQNTQNNIACVFKKEEVLLEQRDIENCLNEEWSKTFKSKKQPSAKIDEYIKAIPKPPENARTPTPDFSINNIRRILLSKTPTAPGHTGITWKMLAKAPNSLIEQVSKLLQSCYDQNVTPEPWFKGITVLIPKPNTPPTPGGFRPITLLPIEYKLYSQILTDSLAEWLQEFNIIPHTQNGARPERGCDSSLWSYLTVIRDANLSNRELHALYIDYSKAFDSVEHWVFKLIFSHLNIGKLGNTIHALLSPAFTHLKINDEISQNPIKFERGTKQGDVISPILFLLFMAPLLFMLQNQCKGYHNPTTNIKLKCSAIMDDVLFTSDCKEDTKKAVKIITNFAKITGMDINPKKSAYAWLNTPRHIKPKYKDTYFDLLGSTQPYKYLGVWVSLNLDWSTQQQVLEQSTHSILSILTRKFYLTGATLAKVINATIVAIFGYRMQVIKFDDTWLNKVQIIITRALNHTAQLNYKTNSYQWCMMQGLEWLPNTNIKRYVASIRRNILRPMPDDAAWNIASAIATPANHLCPSWPNPADILAKAGVKPYIANPHPNYINPIITETDTTIFPTYIFPPADCKEGFTDGSLFRPQTSIGPETPELHKHHRLAAAVWDPSITDPISFPIHGPYSSTEAELQGILYYLTANQNTRGLTIYVDSKSAISLACKARYNFTNLNKFKNRVTLRKIREVIKERCVISPDEQPPEAPTKFVTFKHVYSHKTSDSKEYKQMKEWYGDRLDWILQGNKRVDIAAKKACYIPSRAHPIICDKPYNAVCMVNEKGHIVHSTNLYLNPFLTHSLQKEWATTDPTKANRLNNRETDAGHSLHAIRNQKCGKKKNSAFALKLALCHLPTRPTVRRYTKPDKLKLPFYENNLCKYCENSGHKTQESHDHIFWECPAATPSLNPMANEILELVNKHADKQFTALLWWFPTTLESWGGVDVDVSWVYRFDKKWGIRGFIPKGLTNFINTAMTREKTTLTINNIVDIIAERNQKVWINRCKYTFDKSNYPIQNPLPTQQPSLPPSSPPPPPYSPIR